MIVRLGCNVFTRKVYSLPLPGAGCYLPKEAVAESGVGGGRSTPCSKVSKLMAATSLRSNGISWSILLLSHLTSTRISYSESRLPEGRDSMWTTFTPRSCEGGTVSVMLWAEATVGSINTSTFNFIRSEEGSPFLWFLDLLLLFGQC